MYKTSITIFSFFATFQNDKNFNNTSTASYIEKNLVSNIYNTSVTNFLMHPNPCFKLGYRILTPHQWRSGTALKAARQEMAGLNTGRACRHSRSEFSVVFLRNSREYGVGSLERPPWRVLHLQT